MSMNLRYPNITASTEKEQLVQIKSYLHQLVEQLNYALPTAGGSASTQSYDVQGAEVSYYELRSLIIQELQQVEKLFDQLSAKMQADYIKDKESGEFDGPPGPKGDHGEAGFSPTVEVIEINGGHRVTITDASSAQSFDVMDGTGSSTSGLRFKADDGTIFY